MAYNFTSADIENISKIIDVQPNDSGGSWSWKIVNEKSKQSLLFSIYNEINLGDGEIGSLVSVQTHQGYYELHDCSAFLLFEPDEVIFINATDKFVSCLVIGKGCTCSIFSNIRRELINSDFSTLDPAVLLSAMQLSITEAYLP